MKRSFALLFLVFGLSYALAQSPVIDSMWIDESTGILLVYGDFGPSQGQVSCDTIELAIKTWSASRITASIPDTGKGSAGPVVVSTATGISEARMITKWDVDYGTAHIESHSRSVLRDYKKVLFSFRADIHSILIHKKVGQINSQLMKHSVCTIGYAYLSHFEHGELPFLERSLVKDSSFHGDISISLNTQEGSVWIYDIKGLTTRSVKSWIDSTGPHDSVIYGKKDGQSFGISFTFDSLFQIVNYHYVKSDFPIHDSTNLLQVSLYALPPPEAYADVKPDKKLSYIFPNPAYDKLFIANHKEQPHKISIYNMLGQKVLTTKDLNLNNNSIGIEHFPRGVYWIQIDNLIQKIIFSR